MKRGFAPIAIIGCIGCATVFAVLGIGLMTGLGYMVALDGGGSGSSSGGGGTVIRGEPGDEVEFVLTHYHPCVPEYLADHGDCDPTNGGQNTANMGKVIYNPNASPMGFQVEYRGNVYDYSVAVPQEVPNQVLGFVFAGEDPKTGATFDNKKDIFVALDHFGGCATNPKAMDIMATTEKYNEFFQRLKDAGLVTDRTEQNGCSTAQKPVVKGTLAEIISIGSGGS